jgi:hypothetical protein
MEQSLEIQMSFACPPGRQEKSLLGKSQGIPPAARLNFLPLPDRIGRIL